jgi:hypothetical protein
VACLVRAVDSMTARVDVVVLNPAPGSSSTRLAQRAAALTDSPMSDRVALGSRAGDLINRGAEERFGRSADPGETSKHESPGDTAATDLERPSRCSVPISCAADDAGWRVPETLLAIQMSYRPLARAEFVRSYGGSRE